MNSIIKMRKKLLLLAKRAQANKPGQLPGKKMALWLSLMLLLFLLFTQAAFAGTYLNESTRSPASGSTVSNKTPTINIQAYSDISGYDKNVTIDGVWRTPYYNSSTRTISATPASSLAEGYHTVNLDIGVGQWYSDG